MPHPVAALAGNIPPDAGGSESRWSWAASALLYAAFSAAVFAIQGSRPLLGSDHLSYFLIADEILASCPLADYWRETISVRTYGVVLAYLYAWTGSHVLSMKIVLAACTVLYLLAAELFFRLFAKTRTQAVLFAILSGFAVSFGIASWGVTDSTALLARSLVAPIMMFSMWIWLRYDGRPTKYLAFPILVLGSILHLSTFYLIGVLVLVEAWDFLDPRRARLDRNVAGFAAGLLGAGMVLLILEYAGLSSQVIGTQVPDMLRSVGLRVENIDMPGRSECRRPPASSVAAPSPPVATPSPPVAKSSPPVTPASPPAVTAPAARAPGALSVKEEWELGRIARPLSAREAWDVELSLRPWRNMPLPTVNVANALASSALILLLALAGMLSARRAGYTRADRVMTAMFFAVPVFAFGPQTALWVLRKFTGVYPVTIEEVRAISLIMIPSLYFILRLFNRILETGHPRRQLAAGAVIASVVVLPLFMKSLPHWAREGILSAMVAFHMVDPTKAASLENARSALGLSAVSAAPLYYSTQNVREWLARNTPPGARILTDRDDMILLRDRNIIGNRQVGATAYYATLEQTDFFLQTSRAMGAKDTGRLRELARSYGVDFVVVPWRVEDAAFRDDSFSVLAVRKG